MTNHMASAVPKEKKKPPEKCTDIMKMLWFHSEHSKGYRRCGKEVLSVKSIQMQVSGMS